MKLSLALSLSAHLQLVYFIYSLSISVIWVCMLLKLLYLFAFTGAVSICSLARSLVELTWTFGAVRRYNVFSVKVMLHLCTWLYQFIFTLSNVISLGSSLVELRAACVCACCGLEAASSFSGLVFASLHSPLIRCLHLQMWKLRKRNNLLYAILCFPSLLSFVNFRFIWLMIWQQEKAYWQ